MRVQLTVAYDGTNYHGWQLQPNGITIESVLNQALLIYWGRRLPSPAQAERMPACILWEILPFLTQIQEFRQKNFLMP